MLPELRSIIEATPCGKVVTAFGKPFDANGFGNKMRAWCDQAGLPNCTTVASMSAVDPKLTSRHLE